MWTAFAYSCWNVLEELTTKQADTVTGGEWFANFLPESLIGFVIERKDCC